MHRKNILEQMTIALEEPTNPLNDPGKLFNVDLHGDPANKKLLGEERLM